MTPVCAAASNLETCMCSAQAGNSSKQACTCSSQRSNLGNLTFSNIVNNNSACYCDPNQQNVKSCNCCVSEAQFLQVKPVCSSNSEATACKCDASPVNGSISCNCNNRYFFNTSSVVKMSTQKCACARANSTLNQTTVDCQCCASQNDIVSAPKCKI